MNPQNDKDMNEFPEAPPETPRPNAIAGEIITETFDYDDGRQVIGVHPARPARSDRIRR